MFGSRFYEPKELVYTEADRESGVRDVSEGCPKPVRELSEGVRDAPETVRIRPNEVRIDVRGRNQTWKRAKTRVNLTVDEWWTLFKRGTGVDGWRIMALIIVSLITVVACGSTIHHKPILFQVQAYAICTLAWMAFDPIRIVGKMLAPQSRCIIGCFAIALVAGINNPSIEFGIMYFVLASFFTWTIYKLNRIWMAAHLWMMTEQVRIALTKDESTVGIQQWNTHGKRECRTILSETGCDFNDYVLTAYAMPSYLCGFYSGYKVTTAAENRAKEAETALELEKSLASERKKREEQYKKQAENAEEEREMYKQALQEENKVRVLEAEVETRDNTEEIEHMVLRLRAEGVTIRDIVHRLGIKKNQVEKIIKKYG